MSNVMLFGVLRMPYEMAIGDELTRRQFWDRAQEAADRIEQLERELAEAKTNAATNAKLLDEALQRLHGGVTEARRCGRDQQDYSTPDNAALSGSPIGGIMDDKELQRRANAYTRLVSSIKNALQEIDALEIRQHNYYTPDDWKRSKAHDDAMELLHELREDGP